MASPRRSPEPSRPPASALRAAVETHSRVLLVYLSQRPSWMLPLGTAVLLVAGLFSPPFIGVPLLLLVFLLVGWLSYLSWPVVPSTGRLLRVAVLGLLALAVVRTIG